MAQTQTRTPRVPTAQRLRQVRTALRLGQVIFGKPLGLSQSNISELEESRPMTRVIALAIEHIYGIQAQWLLSGTGPQYTVEGPRACGGSEDVKFGEALDKHPEVIAALRELLGVPVPPPRPAAHKRERR